MDALLRKLAGFVARRSDNDWHEEALERGDGTAKLSWLRLSLDPWGARSRSSRSADM